MKIIIPMAGLGSRFKSAADTNPEYNNPKPFINVRGYPMVRWATGSLPFIQHPGQKVSSPIRVTPGDLIFIILEEHDKKHEIELALKRIYSDAIRVIKLPKFTRGASETVYQAKPFVSSEEDIIVTDSDHYFDGVPLEAKIIKSKNTDIDGIIPVFIPPKDNIPRWSYSLTEKDSTRVLKVGEKDKALMETGAHANIGAYYFSKAKFFFDMFEKVDRENKMFGEEGKKEFYVAPLYQEMLDEGKHLEAVVLSEVWGLGTPNDLEHFLAKCPRQSP